MDVEAIVEKYYEEWQTVPEASIRDQLRAAMTDKMRDDAIREAARNAAVDEYFKARPQLMRTRHEECLVEAGFDRGWRAAQAEQSAELERLRKDAWHGIETAPTDGTDVDLYGYLAYDVTDIRLTNCAFTDGEWKYFVCGEMRPITDIAFTPEYWRPIIAPNIDAAIAAEEVDNG